MVYINYNSNFGGAELKFKHILAMLYCIILSFSLFACKVNIANDEEPHPTNNEIATTEKLETTEPTEDTTISETNQDETTTTTPPEATETEPTEPPKPTSFDIVLSFAGDCTLSDVTSSPQWHGFEQFWNQNKPSYFLEKVKPIFEEDDFTIVNLECVLSDQALSKRDKGEGTAFWFKSGTNKTELLTAGSVEGVSLANNHTFDYGNAGFEDTKQALISANLRYGYNNDVMYFEKNGFVIAVICHGLWYESQANEIITILNTVKENSDYQIVFWHGGTEKLHAPEEWKVRASHKLIDNGADLVIGNHPHVLQPIEEYHGAQIVYSLGNFCYGGHLQPRNRTMIYQMRLTINCESLEIETSEQNIIPCYIYTTQYNNYQPTPIEDQEEIDRVMKFLNGELELPY